MAHIRKLPSGLYQATVYTPNGRRFSPAHELRGAVKVWADNLEQEIRDGEFIDPRLAEESLSKVWRDYGGARRLEMASRKRDASIWKCWVEPRWGSVGVGTIMRPDIKAWVNEMIEDDVGAWTVVAAINLLKALFDLAIDARMIRANPARGVKPPVTPKHKDRVATADEEQLILERFDELFPGRRDGRLFVEGLFETGARWEEMAAVRREAVDLRGGLIHLGPVRERDGRTREYPKGARDQQAPGFRWAPVGKDYLNRLREAVLATPVGGDIYTAPAGGPLRYETWLSRVWNRVMRVPVLDERGKPTKDWVPLLPGDPFTPHDCRHTLGTRLADGGMEEHHRMALMGHKDQRSARRYTHSNESRFDQAREIMERARRPKSS